MKDYAAIRHDLHAAMALIERASKALAAEGPESEQQTAPKKKPARFLGDTEEGDD